MGIAVVTVIGANGTMGLRVSALFGAFGNCKVYMVCKDQNKAMTAKEQAIHTINCKELENNLIPETLDNLEQCIECSDLVYESVAEDLEIKQQILKRSMKKFRHNQIYCTGTSGISVEEMSKCIEEEKRKTFMGMHLANPPYSLTMCEIIPCSGTDLEVVNSVVEYSSKVLRRTVAIVKDIPGFVANRIAFRFLNDALQEACLSGKGLNYIDSLLDGFTGRTLPPLATIDMVGLDVHTSIVDNIFKNSEESVWRKDFKSPELLKILINKGYTGCKNIRGLYCWENGTDNRKEYDFKSGQYKILMENKLGIHLKILNILKRF